MAVNCANASVGSCCTDSRTGHLAFKYSTTNIYLGESCADAHQAYCLSKGQYGTRLCPGKPPINRGSGPALTTSQTDPYGKAPAPLPSRFPKGGPAPRGRVPIKKSGLPITTPQTNPYAPDRRAPPPVSTRPKAQTPQCGTFYGNRGFVCCCKGNAACPTATGIVFTKDRASCCNTFGDDHGRCYGDTGPTTKAIAPKKVLNFPGGQRQPTIYQPISPTMRPTAPTLPPTTIPQPPAAIVSPDTGQAPITPGLTDAPGTTPPPTTTQGITDQLCPYFKWMPGTTDCKFQVLAGVAVIALGGVLLLKVVKGR